MVLGVKISTIDARVKNLDSFSLDVAPILSLVDSSPVNTWNHHYCPSVSRFAFVRGNNLSERVDEQMLRWTLNEEDNVIDIGLEGTTRILNYMAFGWTKPNMEHDHMLRVDVAPSSGQIIEALRIDTAVGVSVVYERNAKIFTPESEKALEWKDYLNLFFVSDDEAETLWPSVRMCRVLDYTNTEINESRSVRQQIDPNRGRQRAYSGRQQTDAYSAEISE
ncbi:hypothetical protein Tco_0636094 [Tanacetum coccineum]